MKYAIQWLRSLLFVFQMYLMMLLMAIAFTPIAAFSRRASFAAVHTYTGWVRWSARWMIGLRTEIRGTPPVDGVVIASKHQSFLDIILIVHATPRPRFIMKKELIWAPIVGFYAKRIGCIAVDRGKRAEAIRKMVTDLRSGASWPGQLIIFPQGTRVAPGKYLPYKVGAAVLYRETGQQVVPAATNVGVFWPRHGIMRKPGVAVVEFLDPIDQGLRNNEFLSLLEERVETASNALMAEAGFTRQG